MQQVTCEHNYGGFMPRWLLNLALKGIDESLRKLILERRNDATLMHQEMQQIRTSQAKILSILQSM